MASPDGPMAASQPTSSWKPVGVTTPLGNFPLVSRSIFKAPSKGPQGSRQEAMEVLGNWHDQVLTPNPAKVIISSKWCR